MDSNMSKAFELLAVGMITVFAILALVVLIGKMIILIVNRYFPEQQEQLKKTISKIETESFNNKKLAAIVAVVDSITQGRGKVTKVTHIDK